MKRPIVWSCGVTTVPGRMQELLPRTLKSLARAGFDRPRLFVDGAQRPDPWEDRFKLPVTTRHPAIRVFGNWALALAELYVRAPVVDRYAMFQDDIVVCQGLREYLERCNYPVKGYWNLFTTPENQKLAPPGVRGWYPSNQMGRGALALVFDQETVVTLLTHAHFVMKPQDPRRGHRAVDGGVVTALRQAGWTEYVHDPSLVEHTGTVSSMGNHPHRCSLTFPGEEFDATELL